MSDTDNVVENLFSESSGRFVILTNEPEWIVEKSRSKGIVASIIGKVNKKTSILTIDNTDYDLKTIVNNYFNFLEEVIGNG